MRIFGIFVIYHDNYHKKIENIGLMLDFKLGCSKVQPRSGKYFELVLMHAKEKSTPN